MDKLSLILKYKVLDDFNDKFREKTGKDFFVDINFVKDIDDAAQIFDEGLKSGKIETKYSGYKNYGSKLYSIFSSARNQSEVDEAKKKITEELNKTNIFDNLGELSGRNKAYSDAMRTVFIEEIKPIKEIISEKLSTEMERVPTKDQAARAKIDSLVNHDKTHVDKLILSGNYEGNEVERFNAAVTNQHESFKTLAELLEQSKGKPVSEIKANLESHRQHLVAQQQELADLNKAAASEDQPKIANLLSRLNAQLRVIKRVIDRNEVQPIHLQDLTASALSIAQGKGDVEYTGTDATKEWLTSWPTLKAVSKGAWDGAKALVKGSADFITPTTVKDLVGVGDGKAWEKNIENGAGSGYLTEAFKYVASAEVIGAPMRRIGGWLEKVKYQPISKAGTVIKYIGEGLGTVSKSVKYIGRASGKSKVLRDQILNGAKSAAQRGNTTHAETMLEKARNLDHSGIVKYVKNLFSWTKRNKKIADTHLHIDAAKAKDAHAAAAKTAQEAIRSGTTEAKDLAQKALDATNHQAAILHQRTVLADAEIALKNAKSPRWKFWGRNDVSAQEAAVKTAKTRLSALEEAAAKAGDLGAAAAKPMSWYNPKRYLPNQIMGINTGGLTKAEKAYQAFLRKNETLNAAFKVHSSAFDDVIKLNNLKNGNVDGAVKEFESLFTNRSGVTIFKKQYWFSESIVDSFILRKNNFAMYKQSVEKYIKNLKTTGTDAKFIAEFETKMAAKLKEMEKWANVPSLTLENLKNGNVLKHLNSRIRLSWGNWFKLPMYSSLISEAYTSTQDANAAKAKDGLSYSAYRTGIAMSSYHPWLGFLTAIPAAMMRMNPEDAMFKLLKLEKYQNAAKLKQLAEDSINAEIAKKEIEKQAAIKKKDAEAEVKKIEVEIADLQDKLKKKDMHVYKPIAITELATKYEVERIEIRQKIETSEQQQIKADKNYKAKTEEELIAMVNEQLVLKMTDDDISNENIALIMAKMQEPKPTASDGAQGGQEKPVAQMSDAEKVIASKKSILIVYSLLQQKSAEEVIAIVQQQTGMQVQEATDYVNEIKQLTESDLKKLAAEIGGK